MRVAGMVFAVGIAFSAVQGSEQVSLERRFDLDLGRGKPLLVSNLLGSVEVIGGGRPGIAHIEARVVAEAKEEAVARTVAEGVRFDEGDGSTRSLAARFPIPESGELALPRDEGKSTMSRLLARVFDREQISAEHEGRTVVLGPSRHADRVAVHLKVQVPHDASVVVRQTFGSVLAARFRGRLEVETEAGSVRMEQLFGSARVRAGSAGIEVASFQGESLVVESGGGEIRLEDSAPRRVEITTTTGLVEAARVQAGDLKVATSDADIEFDGVEAASFDLRTESGEIRMGTRMKGLRRGAMRTGSGDVSLDVGGVTPFAVRATAPEGSVVTDRLPGLEEVGREGAAVLLKRGRNGAQIDIATDSGEVSVRPL